MEGAGVLAQTGRLGGAKVAPGVVVMKVKTLEKGRALVAFGRAVSLVAKRVVQRRA